MDKGFFRSKEFHSMFEGFDSEFFLRRYFLGIRLQSILEEVLYALKPLATISLFFQWCVKHSLMLIPVISDPIGFQECITSQSRAFLFSCFRSPLYLLISNFSRHVSCFG